MLTSSIPWLCRHRLSRWSALVLLLALTASTAEAKWQACAYPDTSQALELRPVETDGFTLEGRPGSMIYQEFRGDFDLVAKFHPATPGEHQAGVALYEGALALPPRVLVFMRAGNEQTDERPLYVRMVRLRTQCAVYMSRDGRRWFHRDGGRTLSSADGPVTVGLVARQGRAQWQAVTLRPRADFAFTTTGVGNSLPGPISATVSFNMTALWVAGDGTCYTTSFFEEQGHCLAMYRDGRDVGPGRKSEPAGRAITGNDRYVFVATQNGFRRYDRTLGSPSALVAVNPERKQGQETVRGLALAGGELLVANADQQRIEVYDVQSLERRRQFDFARPGALAVDGRGRLWVAREGWEKSVYDHPLPRPGRVLAVDPRDGRELAEIPGVEIPNALAAAGDRVLVADNGPDQQVKVFDVTNQPRLVGVLGQRGGIYAGTPGQVRDAKLNGLTGVGMDAKGNIYVSTTGWSGMYTASGLMANATRLLAFAPEALGRADARAKWVLESPGYIFDGGTLDPDDPSHLYIGADQIYAVDWTQAGATWTPLSFTLNLRDYYDEGLDRRTRCTPYVRRLGGQRLMYLASPQSLAVYRFDTATHGEMAIPAAVVRAFAPTKKQNWPAEAPSDTRRPWVWTDGSAGQPRDGVAQPAEYVEGQSGRDPGDVWWHVDAAGDIWYVSWYSDQVTRVPCLGLEDGVPRFGPAQTEKAPSPFLKPQRCWYDRRADVMVLAGNTSERPGAWIAWVSEIVRYENWSKPERRATMRIRLPDVRDEPYEISSGFAVAEPFVFTTSRPGRVQVYDLRLGNRVLEFFPGPEVNGSGGYFDRSDSAIQAFALPDGRYVVLAQENAYCKVLAYQWRPDAKPTRPVDSAPRLGVSGGGRRTMVRLETDFVGMIQGYVLQKRTDGGPWTPAGPALLTHNDWYDEGVTPGQRVEYRAAIVNASGQGPWSGAVGVIPQEATAKLVGIDAQTQGEWIGKYGQEGRLILGDPGKGNADLPNDVVLNGGGLRAEEKPAGKENWWLRRAPPRNQERAGGVISDSKVLRLELEFTDGRTHRVSFYSAGHGNGYGSDIRVLDAASGKVLAQTEVEGKGPDQGRYVTWDLSGRVVVEYERKPKAFGNFVAGIFFDKVPDAK